MLCFLTLLEHYWKEISICKLVFDVAAGKVYQELNFKSGLFCLSHEYDCIDEDMSHLSPN